MRRSTAFAKLPSCRPSHEPIHCAGGWRQHSVARAVGVRLCTYPDPIFPEPCCVGNSANAKCRAGKHGANLPLHFNVVSPRRIGVAAYSQSRGLSHVQCSGHVGGAKVIAGVARSRAGGAGPREPPAVAACSVQRRSSTRYNEQRHSSSRHVATGAAVT